MATIFNRQSPAFFSASLAALTLFSSSCSREQPGGADASQPGTAELNPADLQLIKTADREIKAAFEIALFADERLTGTLSQLLQDERLKVRVVSAGELAESGGNPLLPLQTRWGIKQAQRQGRVQYELQLNYDYENFGHLLLYIEQAATQLLWREESRQGGAREFLEDTLKGCSNLLAQFEADRRSYLAKVERGDDSADWKTRAKELEDTGAELRRAMEAWQKGR